MISGESINSGEPNNNKVAEWDSLKEVAFSPDVDNNNNERDKLTDEITEKLNTSSKKQNIFKKALMIMALATTMSSTVACSEKTVDASHYMSCIEEYGDHHTNDDTWKVNIVNNDGETISFDNDNFKDLQMDNSDSAQTIEAFLWSEEDECMYHAFDNNGNGTWDEIEKQDLNTGEETKIKMTETGTAVRIIGRQTYVLPEEHYTKEAKSIIDKLPNFSKLPKILQGLPDQ